MSDQEKVFSEYVERVYRDPRIDHGMNDVETFYADKVYGSKGHVLVVPSPYNGIYEDKSIFKNHSCYSVKRIKDGSFVDEEPSFFDNIIDSLVSDRTPISLIPNPYVNTEFLVGSAPRKEAEYNPHLWQLVSCGVLLCHDGFVFLKNNDSHPRLPGKVTLIQGHIDPKKEMHTMPASAFIRLEFVRELVEELYLPSVPSATLAAKTRVVGAVQISSDEVGMDHVGLFCVTDITETRISAYEIVSNEPERHKAVVCESLDDIKYTREMDSWFFPLLSGVLRYSLKK